MEHITKLNRKELRKGTLQSQHNFVSFQNSNQRIDIMSALNGDIFFTSSQDGINLSTPKNLSNDNISVIPVGLSNQNNIFVTWQKLVDEKEFLFDIIFSYSSDGGNTFSTPKNLSNNPKGDSFRQQIGIFGKNLYTYWTEWYLDDTIEVLYSYSSDGGNTFSTPKKIIGI